MNAIRELQETGQSIWLDTISRDLMTSGKLRGMIEEDGLLGMTSNPAIFEKAIDGSPAYDPSIASLARRGFDTDAIYQNLAVEDIRMAADLLAPVYASTDGLDGYVSLEVSPLLACDTEGTVKEGRELHAAVGRPNVYIKVPATAEGLPAIRDLLAHGISVNVTLLFAVERYVEVVHTYLDGLEALAERGGDLGTVRSVASFFVSRIDTLADEWIDTRLEASTDASERQRLENLKGKLAIANAKVAYQHYGEIFNDDRFAALKGRGAHTQRLLWASTSTKNPDYPDTLYVDNLIGPDTVNTVPEATYHALIDHGTIAMTLNADLEEAHAVMERFEGCGFSISDLTQQLLDEGVEKFAEPFDKLMRAIEVKRVKAGADEIDTWLAALGPHEAKVRGALQRMDAEGFAHRLWGRDPTLWTEDASRHASIRGRLGWLTISNRQRQRAPELMEFGKEIKAAGFRHVVLCGMGGSSLGAEVLCTTLDPQDGAPRFQLLDSTVPAQVTSIAKSIDPKTTLFIISSKSGGATETLSFCTYFHDALKNLGVENPGENFVAITDPGSPLEELARGKGFRRIFAGEPEIGGRFSVLSNFGMAPSAAAGLDVAGLLERAERMQFRCSANVPCALNSGIVLGAILSELAKIGRDKLTIVPSPGIAAYGAWLEQLMAESTGKQGTGIIPLGDESLGKPADYGSDRVFAYLRLAEAADAAQDAALAALADAGHPVLRINVPERLDVAAEFFRWEMATATVGALLNINAFDEPNVQESKDNTKALLSEYQKKGSLPKQDVLLEEDGIVLYTDERNLAELKSGSAGGFEAALAAHLARLKKGDYLTINAYIEQAPANHEKLQRIRIQLRDAYKVATMLGYGPRFLHSTGQLHKGGPNTVVVLQLTCDTVDDVPIAGEPYSFGVLKDAQALGDFQSLSSRHRRALRVHLGGDVGRGLDRLGQAIETIVGRKR